MKNNLLSFTKQFFVLFIPVVIILFGIDYFINLLIFKISVEIGGAALMLTGALPTVIQKTCSGFIDNHFIELFILLFTAAVTLAFLKFNKELKIKPWTEIHQTIMLPIKILCMSVIMMSLVSNAINATAVATSSTAKLINSSLANKCLMDKQCAMMYKADTQPIPTIAIGDSKFDYRQTLIFNNFKYHATYLTLPEIKNRYSNESEFGNLWAQVNKAESK